MEYDNFSLAKKKDSLPDFDKIYGSEEKYISKLKAIAQYYRKHSFQIYSLAEELPMCWYKSYPIDWSKIFTPIEYDAWMCIRGKGRMVMYPQYPVLNYHADFGNPYHKIALEIDGEYYHQDKEKDIMRDVNFRSVGWTVYHVSGSEMKKQVPDSIYEWLLHTGDGVIESIKEIYFRKRPTIEDGVNFRGLCYKSLQKHKLI